MSQDLPNFSVRVPDGDTFERRVCDACGFIDYENPKIVAGAVVRSGEQVLLCRRAIEPRLGFWTLPAGFLEQHETPQAGAAREAWEEAKARISITGLLGVYSIPRISQVQLIYIAELIMPEVGPAFAPGEESLEVALFDWADIPWGDLAFPSVAWSLNHRRQVWDQTACPPFSNPD
jgi:ADP-ribose pyrophosphatase YjhB (NUDIX family)